MKPKILFIGGSLNQTTIAHSVARHLEGGYDCYFTPFYTDGVLEVARRWGWLDFTVIGHPRRLMAEAYLREHGLRMDYGGKWHEYDLVVMVSDLIVPANVHRKKVILIQEGMTDPETWRYHLVKALHLPRYLAGTSTTGLSDAYDYFCVASAGYRDLFIRKGVKPEKILVTGIPNFDHATQYLDNDFPYQGYVLVATSDARETFKRDNRRAFLQWAVEIAGNRPMIFKLHPNEKILRAVDEIHEIAPQARIFTDGPLEQMIANCDVLITQYSSCVYNGLALGKECHSYFDLDMLRELAPLQNGGSSGYLISLACRKALGENVDPQQTLSKKKLVFSSS
ncbi:MAG: hypothetical protein H6636_10945 [Anaerolineales bacterium]|nr:hypothetical protein [Anaerolineales bacterium]